MVIVNWIDFIHIYPEYEATSSIGYLRKSQYPLLEKDFRVYLDYTGAGLFAASQLQAHQNLLIESFFSNPHSYKPASTHSTQLIEKTRERIQEFFNASPEEYMCVFTQNASRAL